MYDAATREWVSPDEYLNRKAARKGPSPTSPLPTPYTMPDTPEYVSPVGTGLVNGRVARREDLKRAECREVDPGEYKPTYVNKSWAKKRGFKFTEE